MPNSTSHSRVQEEKNRKGKLGERATSFHERNSLCPDMGQRLMIRPRTVPDLLDGRSTGSVPAEKRPKLLKFLLNVTIQRSLGALQVLMLPESTAGDLIAAALQQYAKEGRRPIFPSTHPSGFDLHYSQFSLESLDPEEMLMALGSRNFFLCLKKAAPAAGTGGDGVTMATSFCSKQAKKTNKIGLPWLKFLSL